MIVTSHIIDMINHWLSTPVNGYFGSDYGADINSMLLRPLDSDIADSFIAKMKRDIPILEKLDGNQLSLYADTQGFERKIIYLSVGSITINLNEVSQAIG